MADEVLLVEDEQDMLEMVRYNLEQAGLASWEKARGSGLGCRPGGSSPGVKAKRPCSARASASAASIPESFSTVACTTRPDSSQS